MKLRDYLESKKISREAFGKAIGAHPISVVRYVTGARVPSRDKMQKIITATDGAVQLEDFFKQPGHAEQDPAEAVSA